MMEDGLTEDDDFDIFEALGVSKTKSTETKSHHDPLAAFMDDETDDESVEDLLRILAQEEIQTDQHFQNIVQNHELRIDVESIDVRKDRDAYHLLLELTDGEGMKIRPFATVVHRNDEIIGLKSPKNLPEQWKDFFKQLLYVLQNIMIKQFKPSPI